MNRKSGLAAVLALGIMAGGGGGAYAASGEPAADTKPAVTQQQCSREMAGNRKQALPDLDELISAGAIDQATVDRLAEFTKQQAADHKAEMDQVKAMTAEERQAYFKSNKDARKAGFLAEAVEAGIITQAQAEAIQKLLPQKAEVDGKGMAVHRQEKLFDLSKQVSEGAIDQATADRLTEFMKQQAANRKTEMDEIKAMTAEERQTYFKSNKDAGKAGFLSEAVEAGIITQAQAEAIQEGMKKPDSKPLT